MSAHNASIPFAARLQTLLWILVARLGSRWWLRACFRAVGTSFPFGGIVGALADVSDRLPGSHERIMDLALAGGAAACVVLLLRWIGRKHGGIVAAIKLTAWSYAFWQSLVVAAFGTWIAAGMDGTTDTTLIVINAVLAVVLFIPSSIMLRRLDPDF